METTTVTAPVRRSGRRTLVFAGIAALSVVALVWAIMVTRPDPEPAVAMTSPGLAYTTPLARFASNAAAIAAVGSALFLLLLGAAGRARYAAIADRARVIAVGAGLIWVTASTTTWWLQAASVSESGSTMPFAGLASYALRVSSGRALVVTVLAAAAFTLLALTKPHNWWAEGCLAVALIGLIAVPLTGHASQSTAMWLTSPAICLHLCAVSLWVGGLALTAVLVSAHRSALALVLPRFSTVAGLSLATVAVTGFLLAGPRLLKDATPDPFALVNVMMHSPAGWLVTGKLIGLMLLAATGGYIRQFLMPSVQREETSGLAKLATVEVTLMAVTIALATALARPL
ncbi:putative copper resistance protein D [Kribbella sp. VKM Ac-2527]|uniref:Putative copper resistance protein D n=1 Tax=Kribbella caucasensis TaxID=2512215 RepID=A0A4R6K6R5_9ACTN|nr:CopD family protein [Kribbella sp. VKM Ac-2527]TDO44021.1 putative copper resistance protein D [Kribbella sp. VKM Ac-2527]